MRNIQYEDPYVTVKSPKKRTFVLSKVKDPLYLSSIKPKINQSFEDKDIFLDIKSPIIINKFPQGPKYDSNKKIIPFSYIGPITTITKSKKIKYDNSVVTSKPNKTNISFSISPCNIHQIQSSSSRVTLNRGNDTMKKKIRF